ncbi:MAG: hypothetical protein EON51_19015 [Acinetobacter sp.]|nr:MAG: hypothetical protein EON51_19015 [Acinetobacter sp.]
MTRLFILILACCFFSCRERTNLDKVRIPDRQIAVDITDDKQYIAILNNKDDSKDIELNHKQLILLDSLINEAVNEYNVSNKLAFQKKKKKYIDIHSKTKEFVINLKDYKRQYFPILNKQGEKEVVINCFCYVSDNNNWKTEEVVVNDGGKCYFNLKINLQTEKYYDFSVNGNG